MSKMKQEIVIENTTSDFRRACQTMLEHGWRVIPGTVVVQMVYAPNPTGPDLRYVAFFEKGN